MPIMRSWVQALVPSAATWGYILKIGVGTTAVLYHSVSGASPAIQPVNGSFTIPLTNGVDYGPVKLSVSQQSPGSWSSDHSPLHTQSGLLFAGGINLSNKTATGGSGYLVGSPNAVAGNYTATITVWERSLSSQGSGNKATQLFTFTVVDPPATPGIGRQPSYQLALPGGSATLKVNAIGAQPLTYQWRFNGSPLSASNPNLVGVTANILVINNCVPTNGGNYDVVITNSFGAVTSSVALVTVLSSSPRTNTVSTFASVQSAANAATDISELGVGYVKIKYAAITGTGTGCAKGYFQFDLTGLNPDPNIPATLRIYRMPNSQSSHVQVWALNQPYDMSGSITWNNAQANNPASEFMISDPATDSATFIYDTILAGGGGNFDVNIPAPWGGYVRSNKLTLVLTPMSDTVGANGFRAAVTNIYPYPQLLFTTNGIPLTPPVVSTGELGTYGTMNLDFTNTLHTNFIVLMSTNINAPINTWSNIGQALEDSPYSGHYTFQDYQPTNTVQRYYRFRTP